MPRRQRSVEPSDMSNDSVNRGLGVRLVDAVTGTPLPQIHISKTVLDHLTRPNRYVTFVVPGRYFSIEITTGAEFDWKDANALEVTIAFDAGDAINQKRVFLMGPNRGRNASSLNTDNALLVMRPTDEGLSGTIERVLIQDPSSCEGRVFSYRFKFGDPGRDDNPAPWLHTTRPAASDKVSEHQGKIRIEVTRKLIRAGSQRFPGLHDDLTKTRRSSTQALVSHRVALEAVLEKDEQAGVLEYGGAFRPAACKQTNQSSHLIFEFLYRDAKKSADLVEPEFSAEIGDHSFGRRITPDAADHGADYCEPLEGNSAVYTPCTETAREPNAQGFSDDTLSSVATTSTPPTFVEGPDERRSAGPNFTSPNQMTAVDSASELDTWRRAREAFERVEEQHRAEEQRERQQMMHLREELETLTDREDEIDALFASRRQELALEEAHYRQQIGEQKVATEKRLSQLEQRRSARQEGALKTSGAIWSLLGK